MFAALAGVIGSISSVEFAEQPELNSVVSVAEGTEKKNALIKTKFV